MAVTFIIYEGYAIEFSEIKDINFYFILKT